MVLNIILMVLVKGQNDLRFWPECWSRVPVSPSSLWLWYSSCSQILQSATFSN